VQGKKASEKIISSIVYAKKKDIGIKTKAFEKEKAVSYAV
jgi:hypothetical protein